MKRRRLILYPGTPDEKTVALDKALVQIGRARDAQIRLAEKNVSGLHAALLLKDESVTLTDLDSTNGTFLNGKKIKQAELRDNDRIKVASIPMLFREETVDALPPDLATRTEPYFQKLEGGDLQKLKTWLAALKKAGTAGREEADAFLAEWQGLKKSARNLDALYHILENTLFLSTQEDLIRTLLSEIRKLLSLSVCGLYLLRDDRFYVLENDKVKAEAHTETISETLLEKVLNSAAPVFIEHVGADSNILGFKSLQAFRIQSILCLPVLDRGRKVMGVLYCVSREKEELGLLQKDRLFLEACSLYVSMSLENLNYRVREKEATREEERTRQESRFMPVIGRLRAEKENLALKQKAADAPLFGMDGATDPGLFEFIRKASKTELPLLLTGETGSGKSVLAREIHGQSRSKRPFVTVDCTTIPSELLESELFGHEKGAFTGAHAKKAGKVESAKDGSLFIDEIGDLPLKLQGKLLRLIQSGEYEPVGSTKTQKTPARLMFATNKDLRAEIKAGRFREDLYFRLNVLQYAIPPLRDKKERILPLAGHFLAVNREKINARVKGFARRAEEALSSHTWPGNVRELENAVMRALVNAEGDRIDIGDLELLAHSTHTGAPPAPEPGGAEGLDLKKAREALDRAYIQKALTLTGRNVSKAAGRLNISRNALMELIKKHGL